MPSASAWKSPRALKARIVDAMWEVATPVDRPRYSDGEFALAEPGGMWDFHYSRDCERPVIVNRRSGWGPDDPNPQGRGFYETNMHVRCRKCRACLAARTRMWVARAAAETSATAAKGLRTWFGTLTFRPEVHEGHEQRAFEAWAQDQPDGVTKYEFDALEKEQRFAYARHQALDEVQRYWKRLRKLGCQFRYFVVFEPHKSGRVHMHWLLHEREGPIRHRQLEAAWGLGHAKVKLVGGRSKRSAGPRAAAFYVAKYLSKSYQVRQLASIRYGKTCSAD